MKLEVDGEYLLGRAPQISGLVVLYRILQPHTMRTELQRALNAAREVPVEELPRLLGDLEEIRCTALARLTAPIVAASQKDELLGVAEAADRLGMSKDYLYRHHCRFPFTRRMGRGLRFSALGIEKYIKMAGPS